MPGESAYNNCFTSVNMSGNNMAHLFIPNCLSGVGGEGVGRREEGGGRKEGEERGRRSIQKRSRINSIQVTR